MDASSFVKVGDSIFWNPANRKTSAVPRHSEIVQPVVDRICKDLGTPRPGE